MTEKVHYNKAANLKGNLMRLDLMKRTACRTTDWWEQKYVTSNKDDVTCKVCLKRLATVEAEDAAVAAGSADDKVAQAAHDRVAKVVAAAQPDILDQAIERINAEMDKMSPVLSNFDDGRVSGLRMARSILRNLKSL